MPRSVPTANTSRWSALRETPKTEVFGAATPPAICHQPCHVDNPGSQAAVKIAGRPDAKMSGLSGPRETACTEVPGATQVADPPPAPPRLSPGSHAAV